MATKGVYKCSICGNTIMTIDAKQGTLVCCGKEMEKLKFQTADPATQKHVPIVEKAEGGISVKVGSTPHPMTAEHMIVYVGVIDNDNVYLHWFKPGDEPIAFFPTNNTNVRAFEYCNVHNLWANQEIF